MITFPNAKINIGLYITGKRPDGYHNLSTVMVPIPWRDILEIVPAGNKSGFTKLNLSGRELCCEPQNNLVFKATELFRKKTGLREDLDIFLRKIIPDGAGLGGGSSDAAYTLKTLNEMFDTQLSVNELKEMAAQLGADCPFFIENKPMIAEGIGDIMTPIDLDVLDGKKILIVKPTESISTSAAYKKISIDEQIPDFQEILFDEPELWGDTITNSFIPVVVTEYPHFMPIIDEIYSLGAEFCSMSGSGSAFYGIFPDTSANLADKAKSIFPSSYIIFEGTLKF